MDARRTCGKSRHGDEIGSAPDLPTGLRTHIREGNSVSFTRNLYRSCAKPRLPLRGPGVGWFSGLSRAASRRRLPNQLDHLHREDPKSIILCVPNEDTELRSHCFAAMRLWIRIRFGTVGNFFPPLRFLALEPTRIYFGLTPFSLL
jgi:hypothetical protein